MSEVINFPHYSRLAVEKIAEELKTFKGDRYAEAVKKHVASTLTHFCEQNERFAEVVYKTKRTLSDCCAEIMKGCGQSISDIDVYRGAVRNYFPNADIDFHMTITINGDAPTVEEMERIPAQKPAKAVEKQTEGKDTTPKEKPAQTVTEPPKPSVVADAKGGAQTPEYRRPTPAPAPKVEKPAAEPKKPTKKKVAAEDTNVIQLSLF